MKQGIGYLYNPRHKKYYQNVYDKDTIIEENEKKEAPQELKRVIKAELLKRKFFGGSNVRIDHYPEQ